jgi:type I restriction enzyme, S subunit
MNHAQLLEHFDRISEAPDAISRLRRFILDLAVRGKLVEQDPNDEPACSLLRQVLAVRKTRWEANQISKYSSSHKTITKDWRGKYIAPPHEIGLFNLCETWTWASALEICELVENGSTPPSNEMQQDDGQIPFIKVYNLTKTGFLDFTIKPTFIPRTTHEKLLARSRVLPGDVLMNIVGPPLGKVSVVPAHFPEWNTNQAVVLFRPSIGIISKYLAFCLLSEAVLFWITRTAQKTVGQSNITVSNSRILPIPLPPLAEQHRIVAKVDELMTLCDKLEAAKAEREKNRDRLVSVSLQRLNQPSDNEDIFRDDARFIFDNLPRLTTRPAHIKQLRQTILNLAVRGKLVPQDPNDEPATELLERILVENNRVLKERKTKEYKELLVNPDANNLFCIPKNWRWVSVGEIASEFRYGTSAKCSYETSGEPVLRIPNIKNGRISIEDLKFGLLPAHEVEALRLRLGDILMVRSNGSLELVGRPALVETHAVGYCYAGYLVRVRTSTTHLYAPYLVRALSTSNVRDQIEIPIRTTVGLKNVNASELGRLSIPLPPLAEQRRIVAKVDELMTICDKLEAQLTITEANNRRLLEAVLYEALSPALAEA